MQLCNGERKRLRPCRMSDTEVMTIIIGFHQSEFRTMKHFYHGYIGGVLSALFPHRLSYNRFIERMREVLVPLCAYLSQRYGKPTGIS